MLRRSTLSDATCAVTNVSSKPSTESCTPFISTCFPRTADGAGVQSGSNACQSSIRRPFLSSPISLSKASGGIRRPEKRRAASKFTPIFMPTSLCPPTFVSPRRTRGIPSCSTPPTTTAAEYQCHQNSDLSHIGQQEPSRTCHDGL